MSAARTRKASGTMAARWQLLWVLALAAAAAAQGNGTSLASDDAGASMAWLAPAAGAAGGVVAIALLLIMVRPCRGKLSKNVELPSTFIPMLIKSKQVTIEDLLHTGAFSRIYVGTWHQQTGTDVKDVRVAVKQCHVFNMLQADQKVFLQKGAIMAKVSQSGHRNIIKVHGLCRAGTDNLILEYCPKVRFALL